MLAFFLNKSVDPRKPRASGRGASGSAAHQLGGRSPTGYTLRSGSVVRVRLTIEAGAVPHFPPGAVGRLRSPKTPPPWWPPIRWARPRRRPTRYGTTSPSWTSSQHASSPSTPTSPPTPRHNPHNRLRTSHSPSPVLLKPVRCPLPESRGRRGQPPPPPFP